jgi:chromate transporter
MSQAPAALHSLADWLGLFGHFLSLSLLSIGGAIATVPEMHRYLVDQQHWLTDAQFNSSIALAQAAPGPNVLFVAVLGWNVGMNAGGTGAAFAGVFTTLLGMLLPSTTLTYFAARWGHRNQSLLAVRAFKQGMAPIVVALLLATSWVLLDAASGAARAPALALAAVTTVLVWRSKIHMLWLLGAGGVLGWFGLV